MMKINKSILDKLKPYLIILIISLILSIILFFIIILPIASYCPPDTYCAKLNYLNIFVSTWILIFLLLIIFYLLYKNFLNLKK